MSGERAWKRPESVLVLVHTAAGEVLLLRRVQPAGDWWQSVTGSLEWDEAEPLTAARRELLEETGLALEPVPTGIVNRFAIMPPWRHRYAPGVEINVEHVFALAVPARVPVRLQPDEHDAFVWMARDAAAERVFSATNRAAILTLVPARRG